MLLSSNRFSFKPKSDWSEIAQALSPVLHHCQDPCQETCSARSRRFVGTSRKKLSGSQWTVPGWSPAGRYTAQWRPWGLRATPRRTCGLAQGPGAKAVTHVEHVSFLCRGVGRRRQRDGGRSCHCCGARVLFVWQEESGDGGRKKHCSLASCRRSGMTW